MMIRILKRSLLVALTATLIGGMLASAGCASGSGATRTKSHFNAGYRGIGGRSAWGRHPSYIDIGGGGFRPTPGAEQLPEMGMPDAGSMDVGGFDF